MLIGSRCLAFLLLAVVSGCSVQSSPGVASAVIELEPGPEPVTEHNDSDISRAEAICQEAMLRGVDFRATGNEPGWLLEISDDDSVLLVLNYGADRYRFDTPTLSIETATPLQHYPLKHGDHRLSLTLEHQRCQDTMSGVFYPTQVRLMFDDKPLYGCGKVLQSASP